MIVLILVIAILSFWLGIGYGGGAVDRVWRNASLKEVPLPKLIRRLCNHVVNRGYLLFCRIQRML